MGLIELGEEDEGAEDEDEQNDVMVVAIESDPIGEVNNVMTQYHSTYT